ncbi:hypothetical protein E9840_02910 [Tissierella creatinini]|nr:hypothetical protein E9840_02910 [Tissierella creatinini]TJX67264.1 hypothetical protein E8P77_05675 [Soehngenia saccharolytica]
MKKKVVLPILTLAIFLLLVGCKKDKEVVGPTPNPPLAEVPKEATEDEKEVIMNDFNVLMSGDSNSEDFISYVDDNIKKLGQIEADTMIDELEKKLEANKEALMNRIFATDKDNELMDIAGGEKYFPEDKISRIKNDDLKEEVQKAYDNMYKLVNLEGEFYPIVDYSKLTKYSDTISDELKEYLEIMALDSDNLPFADGGITITFEELADRIIKTESHLNKYIAGKRNEELRSLYSMKLVAYMKGLPNTRISDENNQVIDKVFASYQETAALEGYITSFILNQYVEDIKANNGIIDASIIAKADRYIAEAIRMLEEYK